MNISLHDENNRKEIYIRIQKTFAYININIIYVSE